MLKKELKVPKRGQQREAIRAFLQAWQRMAVQTHLTVKYEACRERSSTCLAWEIPCGAQQQSSDVLIKGLGTRHGTAGHRCMRRLVVELHDEAALPCLDCIRDGESRADRAAALGADGVHLRHGSCHPCCALRETKQARCTKLMVFLS